MQTNWYEIYANMYEEVIHREQSKYIWSVFDSKKDNYLRFITLISDAKGHKKGTVFGWSSLEKAENWVKNSMDNAYQQEIAKEQLKFERKKRTEEFNNSLKIGDILSGCWGYEAQFWEFYEVVGKQKSFVLLRELTKERRFDDIKYGACSECIVKAGKDYASEEVLKRKIKDGYVEINSYLSVSPWDGREHEEANWH